MSQSLSEYLREIMDKVNQWYNKFDAIYELSQFQGDDNVNFAVKQDIDELIKDFNKQVPFTMITVPLLPVPVVYDETFEFAGSYLVFRRIYLNPELKRSKKYKLQDLYYAVTSVPAWCKSLLEFIKYVEFYTKNVGEHLQ